MNPSALRCQLIDFIGDPTHTSAALRHERDGGIVIEGGSIVAAGPWSEVAATLAAGTRVIDARDKIAAPGFIDTHIHLPQVDVIASPAPGLLPWLERYTFPTEAGFSDPAVCAETAGFFLDELACNGTTSASVFGTVHAGSVEALFGAALERDVRLIAGKCLMDVHCPANLRDTAWGGVEDSARLADRWHGRGRLAYAITPRFAATSSREQLAAAGQLARARPELYVQSHVAENTDEIRWIAELFPEARSYLDVYDRAGLLNARSIYAHCLWLDPADRARMAATGAIAAVSPTSNLFLGSGLFDFERSLAAGMKITLATDVGGGQSFSMFSAMRAAHEVARLRGCALTAAQLWYWASTGAAESLGWQGRVGRIAAGFEADFVLLDPRATPLLARRSAIVESVDELLFVLMILGDDRTVSETYIAGRAAKTRLNETKARVELRSNG
ncbi:MAG: guanine deaminase [Burkholderiaceae bacterium]